MPLHKVVVAAIIERRGEYLAMRRPVGKWGAGMWEFPGGKLEPGEDPRAGLVRECREELGVEIACGPIFDAVAHTYDDLGPVMLIFIHANVERGEPQALEGGAIEWVPASQLRQMDWLPADRPIVERLLAGE